MVVLDLGGVARVSREGATKSRPGIFRDALAEYRRRHGEYPQKLSDLWQGPRSILPVETRSTLWWRSGIKRSDRAPHPVSDQIVEYDEVQHQDSGHWAYVNNSSSSAWGTVYIDCTHKDTRGIVWSHY